jgi:hypothetical protein
MGRTPKSWTADERAAIAMAVDELVAIGMDLERAQQQAEAEVRKLRPDVLVVNEDGSVEPRRSEKSILDWKPSA